MAYTKLAYHIVYGTKRREKLITPELALRLYKYTGGIISKLKGIPVEINGMQEHIHILTYLPPTIALSDFLRIVKSSSSKWINEVLEYQYNFQWASKYGAFTVGETQIEIVRKYIQNQQQHHTKESWEEEFKQLLREHGIECDERYLWD